MNYSSCIKKIYPDISESDFMLQDDSNGKGVYVRKWTHTQPQPTQAEIEAVYPAVLKEQKIKELKTIASQVIYLKAPTFKQANVGMGIYDTAASAPIVKWVKAGRQAVQEFEDRINAVDIKSPTALLEIETIIFDFDSLKARMEEIFITL